MSNIDYNAEVRKLTIDMWLSGSSHFEIKNAIRDYLRRKRRR